MYPLPLTNDIGCARTIECLVPGKPCGVYLSHFGCDDAPVTVSNVIDIMQSFYTLNTITGMLKKCHLILENCSSLGRCLGEVRSIGHTKHWRAGHSSRLPINAK